MCVAQARGGDLAGIQLLVQAKVNVNATDYDRRSCLHVAASEGNDSVIRFLLAHTCIHLNELDRWGGTPLRDAVREGHKSAARDLHAAGAALMMDQVSMSGELCELSKNGKLETLQLLLDCGCDVNAADYDARTPIHLAASEGNVPIIKLLLSLGVRKRDLDPRVPY